MFGSISADDVAAAASIDFSKPVTATLTFKDGSVITLTGAVAGEKHWIQISAPKNDALSARAAGRAFEVAGYRYDGFFRPLDQLLVPKPQPTPAVPKPQPARHPSAKPATAP